MRRAPAPSPARPAPAAGRALWWLTFGLVVAAGGAWVVAAPLFTGPDEVSQARRAAAVVRGQLTGERRAPGPAILLDVRVPELYGPPAEDQWRCFLGPLVAGTPQEPMTLPPTPCEDLRSSGREVRAGTVQYRGQPFFYAVAGLGTLLSDGVAGAYAMRLLGLLPAAAFLASAAVSTRRARAPALAGAALLLACTPAVLYLAASTNPSGLEIAAALSAWAAGMVLADPREPVGARVVHRFGLAVVALLLTRGLGPLFAGAVVVGLAAVAGRERCRDLARRVDVRLWGAAGLAAAGVSLAWLAHVQSAYPLPDRPGSGVVDALGWLPWYLRQSVGVFGTNDSALPPFVATLWLVAAAALFLWGIVRSPARVAALAAVVLLGGLALSVTAEGLSLPPIGFFWQGRYALPLLLGGLVLATAQAETGAPWRSADVAEERRPVASALRVALAAMVVGVHTAAFVIVGRHHAERTGAAPEVASLVGRWDPPVPQPVLLGLYALALLALVVVLTAPGDASAGGAPDRDPVASPALAGTPEQR